MLVGNPSMRHIPRSRSIAVSLRSAFARPDRDGAGVVGWPATFWCEWRRAIMRMSDTNPKRPMTAAGEAPLEDVKGGALGGAR